MTKIIYQLLLFSFVGFLIVSCKKEIVPSDTSTSDTTEVYAGVHDTSFHHFEFAVPHGITIVWDAQNLYGTGFDSLDIDLNGTYDLFITLHVLNPDSLHLLTGMPNPFPSCALTTENGLEVAFYTETFYIGLGQTATATFVDRLDFNERIDVISDWKTTCTMWSENPGGAGTPPFGDWYSASSENYIATKINGGMNGWIKIDASDPKDPKFVSYATQH